MKVERSKWQLSDPILTINGVRQDGNEVAQFMPCMSKHEMHD